MLLCLWETNTCFFLGHLSCDLCWHTESLWHIASLCFFLSFDTLGNKRWKQQVHLLQYAFQFHHNCSFFVSHLSCQWNSFCIFQNALFLHLLACFLSSALLWVNSCYWTFKSCSKNSIKWFDISSSSYPYTQIDDSHLVTVISPNSCYILFNCSPLCILNLLLCSLSDVIFNAF